MKHEIVVDIEGFQMRREMSSDSEDSYISELSDCGTNVTSQIKSHGILTVRFKYHFLGQNG